MSELKPCPFCPDGGEPKISHHSYELEYGARVYCRRCNASGPEIHESMPPEDVEALAIEAWNTRHERTCRVVRKTADIDGEQMTDYTCCFNQPGWNNNYCPNCGAQVIE